MSNFIYCAIRCQNEKGNEHSLSVNVLKMSVLLFSHLKQFVGKLFVNISTCTGIGTFHNEWFLFVALFAECGTRCW